MEETKQNNKTISDKFFDGCIGIDLGTTFSCVGVWLNDHVEIIANDVGNRTTPSWVAFTDNNERIVGEGAKGQAFKNPKRTIYDVKRIIGKQIRADDETIMEDINNFHYDIIRDNNDYPLIDLGFVKMKPEEISAMVLQKMKTTAEAFLGISVKYAVITVPAYFNDTQRQATKNAAKIAGLECLRIINEPTAACFCYGLHKLVNSGTDIKMRRILIFDLGGGTFDVSLLQLSDGIFEVVATSGNTHLGGEDFDMRLVAHFIEQFQLKHTNTSAKIDRQNGRVMRKLQNAAEIAKKQLSQTTMTTVEIESLIDGIDFSLKLSRSKFEMLCDDLFKSCIQPVINVLTDAELQKNQIDDVVLVGGSTRIPKIQEILAQFFDGKELNKSVNPDEAVAYGAAVQGAILTDTDTSGKVKDLLLLDVIPLSLGIETKGGVMCKIIDRNSTIPCEKSQMFSTIEDNQTCVLVQVFEGERKFTKDNHMLGTFELSGIPRCLRGVPKINVIFSVDTNGILSVSAIEKSTNIVQTVEISKDSGRLSEEQIQKMIKDADKFRAQDEIRQDMLESKNSFEKYMDTLQMALSDTNCIDAISIEERSIANGLIIDSLSWLEETERTKEEIDNCKRAVEYHIKPIINKIYAVQLTIQQTEKSSLISKNELLNDIAARIEINGINTTDTDRVHIATYTTDTINTINTTDTINTINTTDTTNGESFKHKKKYSLKPKPDGPSAHRGAFGPSADK